MDKAVDVACGEKGELTLNMMMLVLIGTILVAAVCTTAAHRMRLHARRAARRADGGFLLAFSELLAKVAMSDGQVSADEVETVEKLFADMRLSRAEQAMCIGNFYLAQREKGDVRACLQKLTETLNHVACTFIYGLLWRVANADWRISSEEEELLKEIGVAFGLGEDAAERFRKGQIPTLDRRALEDAGVPPSLVVLSGCTGLRDGGLGFWER